MKIFARSLVYKAIIEMNAFVAAPSVERADTKVADHLTGPTLPFCHSGLSGFDQSSAPLQLALMRREVS